MIVSGSAAEQQLRRRPGVATGPPAAAFGLAVAAVLGALVLTAAVLRTAQPATERI
jgi:hypothetical protein